MPSVRSGISRSLRRKVRKSVQTSLNVIYSYENIVTGQTPLQLNDQGAPEIKKSKLNVTKSPSCFVEEEFNQNRTEFDSGSDICASEYLDTQNLNENLAKWTVKFKVSHSAVSGLLKILKGHSCFDNLPADCRTLLQTPRRIPVIDIHPGKYCHFGLRSGLNNVLGGDPTLKNIKIQISVDGIPISKSSSQVFLSFRFLPSTFSGRVTQDYWAFIQQRSISITSSLKFGYIGTLR